MKISATGIWIKFKGTSCNKYAAIAIICVHVLIFPSWFAATTSLFQQVQDVNLLPQTHD